MSYIKNSILGLATEEEMREEKKTRLEIEKTEKLKSKTEEKDENKTRTKTATKEPRESNEKKTKTCNYCGEEILDVAIKCKYCKSSLPKEKKEFKSFSLNSFTAPLEKETSSSKEKPFKLSSTINLSKNTKIIMFVLFFVSIVLVMGNYHIVLNATDPAKSFVFIKRPYWGFSDIIGDVNICTEAPYFSVMASHPSLCKALQNAEYLESEEARSDRIEQEVKQDFNDASECLRACELDISNTNKYLNCIDDCSF